MGSTRRMGRCSPPSVAGLIRGCPSTRFFFGFSFPRVGLVKAPATTWFLFEAFLLQTWPAKVVESPLPGPGMAIQHLLHPADALSCPLSLASFVSCCCCQLVFMSVLPPSQPRLFCQEVSGCAHLHPDFFLSMTSSAIATVDTFFFSPSACFTVGSYKFALAGSVLGPHCTQ